MTSGQFCAGLLCQPAIMTGVLKKQSSRDHAVEKCSNKKNRKVPDSFCVLYLSKSLSVEFYAQQKASLILLVCIFHLDKVTAVFILKLQCATRSTVVLLEERVYPLYDTVCEVSFFLTV